MKIHSIDIDTKHARKTLDFCDKFNIPRNLTLFIGLNGCGKTRLLFELKHKTEVLSYLKKYDSSASHTFSSGSANLVYSTYDEMNHTSQNVFKLDITRSNVDNLLLECYDQFKTNNYLPRIKEAFNSICKPYELIELPEEENVLTILKNGEYTSLRHISSGERQILQIIMSLIINSSRNSLVFIDDIEMHLHTIWQKRLVMYLRNYPTSQFFITTHSEHICKLFHEDEIIIL